MVDVEVTDDIALELKRAGEQIAVETEEAGLRPLGLLIVVMATPRLMYENTKVGNRLPTTLTLIHGVNMGVEIENETMALRLLEGAMARLNKEELPDVK